MDIQIYGMFFFSKMFSRQIQINCNQHSSFFFIIILKNVLLSFERKTIIIDFSGSHVERKRKRKEEKKKRKLLKIHYVTFLSHAFNIPCFVCRFAMCVPYCCQNFHLIE